MVGKSADDPASIESAVDRLDVLEARRLLAVASHRHDDVLRTVRLAAAADDDERLAVLKAAVDHGLRTRRYLDYWGSSSWAQDASPVVDALADAVANESSPELVNLLQRAVGHLVKVILRADDSNGEIGGLARRVLELHCEACAASAPEPQALAKWIIRFTFDDQDFFQIDPIAYAGALGEKGLAVYRREVAKRSDPAGSPVDPSHLRVDLHQGFASFAALYANERLAILDRNTDRVIKLFGRDLSSPYHFTRVAEALIELGQPLDALAWARRGISETSGWQVAKLYDVAAGLLGETGDFADAVELRREQHDRMPSSVTYTQLQTAARATNTWDAEIGAARAALAARDFRGLVDVLLADGEPGAAWATAVDDDRELHASQWLRLAEAREPTHPADALDVYLRLADASLVDSKKQAYADAVRRLKSARRAATTAGLGRVFEEKIRSLREQHRRRPSLIAMLDKAGLT